MREDPYKVVAHMVEAGTCPLCDGALHKHADDCYMAEFEEQWYFKPRETWDEAKTRRAARHVEKDGCGTPYPGPGFVPGAQRGPQEFNGGYSRDGDDKHYSKGIWHQLPVLTGPYRWTFVISWCWRIVSTDEPVDLMRVCLGDLYADSCRVCGQRAEYGLATMRGPVGCVEAVRSGMVFCADHLPKNTKEQHGKGSK